MCLPIAPIISGEWEKLVEDHCLDSLMSDAALSSMENPEILTVSTFTPRRFKS
jgi:hypothetical protein